MTPTIPIVILAAGKSSRMRGTDKLAELVDGIPLLRAQTQKALAVSDQVFVTLPDADHPRREMLTGLAVTVVPVPDAALGLSASLKAGANALPRCEAFMIFLTDMPELTVDDLRMVVAARALAPDALIWRGASQDGRKAGHPALIHASLLPDIAALTGDTGNGPLLRAPKGRTHLVCLPDDHAVRDLDTPEEWAAWRANTGR